MEQDVVMLVLSYVTIHAQIQIIFILTLLIINFVIERKNKLIQLE